MFFFACHAALVALVIVSRQVKDAMHQQHLQFLGNGMPQPLGIAARLVGGDGNVARHSRAGGTLRWKR